MSRVSRPCCLFRSLMRCYWISVFCIRRKTVIKNALKGQDVIGEARLCVSAVYVMDNDSKITVSFASMQPLYIRIRKKEEGRNCFLLEKQFRSQEQVSGEHAATFRYQICAENLANSVAASCQPTCNLFRCGERSTTWTR
jgi:hypothetical protein